MARLLDAAERTRALADLPGWVERGDALATTAEAPDFAAAIALVTDVADEAEQMDHHPDMDIRWRQVTFALSTHSAGGVTQLDVELAHRIAQAAAGRGATLRAPQA